MAGENTAVSVSTRRVGFSRTIVPKLQILDGNGAPLGEPVVANEKTIRPDGDPKRLERLLATSGRRPGDEDGAEDEHGEAPARGAAVEMLEDEDA